MSAGPAAADPPRAAADLDPASLRWQWCRLDDLRGTEIEAIFMARQTVFLIEQHCLYQDVDGLDRLSFHLAAWAPGLRMPAAYARVVDPGARFTEPSIGRVLTSPAARGRGLGRDLVRRAVALTRGAYPGQAIRIAAQSRLEAFYAEVGFELAGERFIEDGIAHTEMLLR